MPNLSKLTKVQRLPLACSSLTDAGLKHLAGLRELQFLDLHDTKVTAAGVDKLAAALPQCKIEWDGVEMEPK
ncbi:MAG: hypothetical protein AB7O62_08400 [Pirellulales bacterium]